MTAPAYSPLAQLGIHTASPVTKRFDFKSENMKAKGVLTYGGGIRGTLARDISRVRIGPTVIAGQYTMQPNAVEWDLLLRWILGGTPSGSGTVTYPLGDTVTSRFVYEDRVAQVFEYTTVRVNKATVSASEGQMLKLVLDVVACTEVVGSAGSFPSLTIDVANGPFVFEDCVLTIDGTTYQTKNITLTIDNKLDTRRFFNSLTLNAAYQATDRIITVSLQPPYGLATALYAGWGTPVAVVMTFTNGNAVLVFTLANVVWPQESPVVQGTGELMLPITGTAYCSGATLELVTTLNPGP